MSILRILVALVLALTVIGFGYLAVVDVPVRQNEVTKVLPKEAYADAK